MPHANSPLITMKRLLIGSGLSNAYAVKLNDEVVAHALREQRGIELFSNRMISFD